MRFKVSAVRLGATGEHLAERCRDDYCPRLPCRMFKAGYAKGYEEGHAAGYADGYAEGFVAGAASASCSCGGG